MKNRTEVHALIFFFLLAELELVAISHCQFLIICLLLLGNAFFQMQKNFFFFLAYAKFGV